MWCPSWRWCVDALHSTIGRVESDWENRKLSSDEINLKFVGLYLWDDISYPVFVGIDYMGLFHKPFLKMPIKQPV